MNPSGDEVQNMIDESIRIAMNKHNRNATAISMALGFTFMALFVDGLLPPFLNIDINVIDGIVQKVNSKI